MAESTQKDPDVLLAAIQSDEARRGRGRLKVFIGMCPGVGKTYAMLEAARRELAAGRDVVVGYVETHQRKETEALVQGLTEIPRRRIVYRGIATQEFDLDALLARRPQIALVDELAHTNVPGARHPKRWQDAQEILDAGIDVLTTINVQHIESLADTVRQITGVEIRETVPDSVLDSAVMELVDIPPVELLQRLKEGKVYLPERAAAATQNFFREGNLTVLRELALRLVADHVGVTSREFRQTQNASAAWKTSHCLAVAVGPGPFSESLIRWSRHMADSLRCRWIAVHVESPRVLSEPARKQLENNLAAARELGAEVVVTTDDDLVRGILRVARARNATQIVAGKSIGAGWMDRLRSNHLMRRLERESGDIDIHLVRSDKAPVDRNFWRWQPSSASDARQYGLAFCAVAGTAIANAALSLAAGPRVPGFIFLMVVVMLALKVGRGPVLMAGALSALIWDFFFLPPKLTFAIKNLEDAVLFGLYFVVAIVLGQLVTRMRIQEQAERRREERASALYEMSRDLAEANSRDEIVWHLVAQVNRMLNAPVAVAFPAPDKLVTHPDSTLSLSEKELSVAEWAFRQRKTAGRFTDNLPGADALHLPMATERKAFGVLAVKLPDKFLSLSQNDLLETYARQTALVLDRLELRSAAEKARLLSESEKFSRTLLNSISHELRTPLAASTSAASALASGEDGPPESRKALVAEIQEANARLNRIVGNLLDMARLESGQVRPRMDWHDARDLVQTTLRELRRELAGRPVTLELPGQPLLVKLDFTLAQHALGNLLINAATHTAPGLPVEVRARIVDSKLVLTVSDRGPGIAVDVLPRIFDKFFRAPGSAAGGSGLGLAIVKGFVETLGGSVSVENRPGGGAAFTLVFPQPEQPPN